jgi:GNAT superfamily N-acetyltransferase
MKIIPSSEAIKEVGFDLFIEKLEFMCKNTFNLWYDSYYSLHPDKYPNWRSLYQIYLNIAFNHPDGNYTHGFAAIEKGNMIGYVSINHNDFNIYGNPEKDNEIWWMTDVFVFPNWRNKGVASLLINYVIEFAKENNQDLYLACEKELILFYKNKGWLPLNVPHTNLNDHWTIMTLPIFPQNNTFMKT